MKVIIDFDHTKICVSTDNDVYAAFLKGYFQPLIREGAIDDCGLVIDITWARRKWRSLVKNEELSDLGQIGGSTYVSARKAATIVKSTRKKFVSWEKCNNQIFCKTIVYQKAVESILSGGIKRKNREDHLYQITLEALYYPLFHYCYRKAKKIVIHAAAISHNGKGIVLCGLDGMGKTCGTLLLMRELGGHLLSDNLIFGDRQKVYSCYEMIRLHKEQERLVNEHFKRHNKVRCLKDFYSPCKEDLVTMAVPKVLLFPEFTSIDKIETLSTNNAVERVIHLNKLSGELQRYQYFNSLYSLLPMEHSESEREILTSLLSNCSSYRVQMRRHNGLENNMKFIIRELGLK